ncbi:MAG: serine hydrolase [Candidatus Amulumruptor caecigallinarius]|uniref:ChbG/HpnK family deacetylase n=1 Tax=Candidatus Amulumruptor caecigallinarius TaxID=2109911 RepID=A0A4Q0U736_9BACT|nr:MAG: serine hydrolase [Candidatus Amulumruptor caecigallinarius]HJE38941.1 ChbG/HpnK family deacetylase [Candidatus Amulumruptor caecigallinarius]
MKCRLLTLIASSAATLAAMALHEPAQLAVRMDDMGAFHSVNEAVMDIYRNGISRSVEVMPVAAWYPEAVKMLCDAPGLDVGLHLAITSEWENAKWRPLTDAISLVDANGYFLPMIQPNPAYPGQSYGERGYDLAEVEQEFRAQIERVIKDIPQVSHISSHMGCTFFTSELQQLVQRLADEYHLPSVDSPSSVDKGYESVTYADGAYGMMQGRHRTLAEKEQSFINMVKNLKPGKKYMFIDHPAYDDAEMATVYHVGYEDVAADRQGVIDLYKSERVKSALRDNNVQLVTVGQLASPLPRSHQPAMQRAIDRYIGAAAGKGLDIHSVMVLKDGKVLGEKWNSLGRPDTPHIMNSASKTLTSTAAGFAVAEGKLDLDDKVIRFFPDKLPGKVSDNLKNMTVRDLLTMTSGQAKANTKAQRQTEYDWVAAFLAEPVPYTPGTYYAYNGLGTFMVSAIVQKAVGENIFDYLTPRLFRPLGITGITWDENPDGINCGGWGLYLKTEDMAKIGQFYLQKGKWDGKQLLPEWWIEEASKAQVPSRPGGMTDDQYKRKDPENNDWMQGYGYQIWRGRHNSYRADGANGQYILVLPDHNAVVAVTADLDDMASELNLIWEIILPVIEKI